ncbi:hypothetical protein IWQ56_000444 [Coemansia nantahalensis]|uniref:Uncharacterized protein n=1 Tax=Coemansia nantahalensis TaxID=2789366 RepID=A0ACC1JIW5_9FUNG|nr:hypothetical protein IWQ57_006810 [Coemansia nantahalensis]KAJ2774739.1 hypothetical protein IWQ56_000444 [Coemansia nantahalensis]
MASVAAKFTAGLLLGSGSACAFAAYMTEQARLVDCRLRWASAELDNAVAGEGRSLPSARAGPPPDTPGAFRRLAARLSGHAVPLAKAEWNSAVHSTARSLAQADIGADKLVAALLSA